MAKSSCSSGCGVLFLLVFIYLVVMQIVRVHGPQPTAREFSPPPSTNHPNDIADIRTNHKPVHASTPGNEAVRVLEDMHKRINQFQVGTTYILSRTSFAVKYRSDVPEFAKRLARPSSFDLEQMFDQGLLFIVPKSDAYEVLERDDAAGLWLKVKVHRTSEVGYLVGWHFYD